MPSVDEIQLHRRYWHRSILIPLWTQQLLLQLCGAIGFWFAITIFWDGGPSHGSPLNAGNNREKALLATFFILYVSLVLATMGEVLLYSASVLKPKSYLISQLCKTLASAGVWGTLVLYPYVIRDPITNRSQVAVCMSAVFLWLQVPMLSSLVHAVLVYREELAIQRELRLEQDSFASPTSFIQRASETTPLLVGGRVIGGRGSLA